MSLKLPPYPLEYLEINFIDEEIDVKNYVKLQREQTLPFAVSGVINSSLESAECLTRGDDVKRVIEICLNIEKTEYQPGDTVGILPENNIDEVNKIIERLKFEDIADKLFNVSVTNPKKKIPIHIPVIGTIRQILLNNVDIRSIPKKLFLRALRKYATSDEDTRTLDELCSQQGSAEYSKFILEYYPLLELLKKFPSCYPPFTLFLEQLPRLLPRPYSLTNSPNDFNPPNSKIKLIFVNTDLPKNYEGVCSSWLYRSSTQRENIIPLYFRKPNHFNLPEDKTKSIILIAIGTGIAPFISFLEHCKYEETKRKIWLFYGCRYSDRDFLFKDKIERFVKTGVVTKLFKSFSRDTALGVRYVQDNIRLYAKNFVNFMRDSKVYVCGGKEMSDDVFETIINCVSQEDNCEYEDARKHMVEMKNCNEYVEDIWN